MEVFSLEDDDGNDLFITQESQMDKNNRKSEGSSILGDPLDFQSPCASLINTHYSDISDDDLMEIPCSQISQNTSNGSQGYVIFVVIFMECDG